MSKLLVLETKTVNREDIVDLLVGRTIKEVERDLIIRTLLYCGGNQTRASRMLGITPRTMRNKLARFRNQKTKGQDSRDNGEAR